MTPSRSHRRLTRAVIALFGGALVIAAHASLLPTRARAQATFPMKIKRVEELNPKATLKLEGRTVTRSDIARDPGYRIQWHVKKDGKTVAQVNARPDKSYAHADASAGKYTIVLELFFPEYKATSKDSKGLFKPISDEVSYAIDGPPKNPAATDAKKSEPKEKQSAKK